MTQGAEMMALESCQWISNLVNQFLDTSTECGNPGMCNVLHKRMAHANATNGVQLLNPTMLFLTIGRKDSRASVSVLCIFEEWERFTVPTCQ